VPSSFPQWIPSELRSRKLFDAVLKHINNDTVPFKAKEVRLYNIIADKLGLINAVEEDLTENDINVAGMFDDPKTNEQISAFSGQEKAEYREK